MPVRSAFQLKLRPALFSSPFFSQSFPVPRPAKRCVMRSFSWQIDQISKHTFLKLTPYAPSRQWLTCLPATVTCCECSPGLSLYKLQRPQNTTDCKREADRQTARLEARAPRPSATQAAKTTTTTSSVRAV